MSYKPVKFRQPHAYDVKQASDEAVLVQSGPDWESQTVQSQAEDADINVMMRRMGITGHMPVNPRVPLVGDFTEIGDFRSALHAVMQAQEAFMEFPAELRARFGNDPQQLMDFMAVDGNREEAVKLGLVKAPSPPPSPPAAVPEPSPKA